VLVIALPGLLAAQDRVESDSSRYKYLPTGIRIGTDLMTIGKRYYTDYFRGWEVNVDADVLRRYYVTADYGHWASTFALPNGVYGNDGKYFRLGVDINFLVKDPDRNLFFLGFRHAISRYTDYADYSYVDPYFGEVHTYTANANPKAHWEELTLGLRVKIWKFIWLGATGRLKFRMVGKDQWNVLSYEVPGYGRTFKNNWWGLNYQLFVRIPVRE
jgi:hypothetical protein